MATSTVFFPGTTEREFAIDLDSCNVCHGKLNAHGRNRNGNPAMCANCHNADLAAGGSGFALGVMIHSIPAAIPGYAGGDFADVRYPQTVANCDTCHVEGAYNVARESARAISIDPGEISSSWLDDFANTPTAANCGVCHTSVAALGHFNTQGGQVGVPKDEILTVGGLPNGQEACAVCHGKGSAFETAGYHNPGLLVEE
jgi:OmcA/MtrC family decaheme c-type cytochrome